MKHTAYLCSSQELLCNSFRGMAGSCADRLSQGHNSIIDNLIVMSSDFTIDDCIEKRTCYSAGVAARVKLSSRVSDVLCHLA